MKPIPRISLARYLKSRFFPWTLAIILASVVGGGGYQHVKTQKVLKKTSSELVKTERLLAMTEYELKQERSNKKDVKKFREEKRPDGTIIVEREESKEESESSSESSGSSRTVQETAERQTVETVEQQETTTGGTRYSVGVGASSPLILDYSIMVNGGVRVLGPFWLRVGLGLDPKAYSPDYGSVGIEFQF